MCCAVVLDAWSRRVIGWSIESIPSTALVTNALGMAIDLRHPTDQAIIHCDQGTQFSSWAFTRRAVESGLLPSMGSVGDCFDNAVMESFWSRMQVELLNRKRWSTRVELANAIFEYLEIFHNASAGTRHCYADTGRVRSSASTNYGRMKTRNPTPSMSGHP